MAIRIEPKSRIIAEGDAYAFSLPELLRMTKPLYDTEPTIDAIAHVYQANSVEGDFSGSDIGWALFKMHNEPKFLRPIEVARNNKEFGGEIFLLQKELEIIGQEFVDSDNDTYQFAIITDRLGRAIYLNSTSIFDINTDRHFAVILDDNTSEAEAVTWIDELFPAF